MAEPRFALGQVVATPGALESFARTGETPLQFIRRHVAGDWGDVDQDDKAENNRSVEECCRILSAYHLRDGTKIWVITEADRSSTCILLPEEY
jgi:hypothetical protein